MLPIHVPTTREKPYHGHGNKEVIATAIDHPCEDIASILIETEKVGQ
jgi:hypothetical protein